MLHRTGQFLKRQLSLDNVVGELLASSILLGSATLLGFLLGLPVITLAGIVISTLFLTMAGVLAWREGWRPGLMRGVRGWETYLVWQEGMNSNVIIRLEPPPGEPISRQVKCEVSDRTGTPVGTFTEEHISPPGATAHDGIPNSYYYVLLQQDVPLEDGRWKVRWWIARGIGWLPVASRRFRIKRGRLRL